MQYMSLDQIFADNAKNNPNRLFEAPKSEKKYYSKDHG